MAKEIPLTLVTEYTTADGTPMLSGEVGKARIVGRPRGYDADGNPIWMLTLQDPDERMRQRRKAYRERRQQRDAERTPEST